MGGGAGGKSKGSSTSVPQQFPYQEQMSAQYQNQFMPAAAGKPSEFGRQQEQMAGDQAARALAVGQEQIMQNAGTAGIGAPEVANLQRSQQESAVQGMINQVMQARQQYALMAMKMIAGQPLYAQTTKSSESSQQNRNLWGIPLQ